jgi:hypothetical protein
VNYPALTDGASAPLTDSVQISLRVYHLHCVYQCMNSSRKSTSGAKSVGVDVVVEHPRPVFEVAEDSTELLSPKVWCTWFWNLARITASRYHGRLSVNRVSETPCSQSTNLSAFSVVLVSETPNEMGCLVTASTATHTYTGLPPHFTTLSSTAIARCQLCTGSKRSFASTFFIQS